MPQARMPISSPVTPNRLTVSAAATSSVIGTTRDTSSGMRAA